MSKVTLKTTPFGFEMNKIKNPNFSKSKIYVMYHGKNPNGTIITKEAVERNIETIKNIPIVGEFSKDSENFKGHGGKLELDEYGDIDYIHTTSPLGVIPESATVSWEIIKDDKEIEREYLVVDGAYMWNRYEKEINALKGDNYGQSMEIEVSEGTWLDEENAYDIVDFSFSAMCILGINKDGAGEVQPAFSGAKIITYSNKDFKEELDEMLNEFKFSLKEEKGVYGLKLEELLEKYSLTIEELTEKGINVEEFESMENLESEIKSKFNKEEDKEEDEKDIPDEQITDVSMGDAQIEDDKDAKDKAENEVVKDVTTETEGAVDGGGTEGTVDTGTGTTGTETTANTTTADADGTQVTDANFSQKIEDLEKELSNAKSQIASLESEIVEFNKKEHLREATGLIEEFTNKFSITKEDVSEINVHEVDMKQLESKLYEIVGRKASEKVKEENTESKKFSLFNEENKETDVAYASLFDSIK